MQVKEKGIGVKGGEGGQVAELRRWNLDKGWRWAGSRQVGRAGEGPHRQRRALRPVSSGRSTPAHLINMEEARVAEAGDRRGKAGWFLEDFGFSSD